MIETEIEQHNDWDISTTTCTSVANVQTCKYSYDIRVDYTYATYTSETATTPSTTIDIGVGTASYFLLLVVGSAFLGYWIVKKFT